MDVRWPKESKAFHCSGAGTAAAGKPSFGSAWSREQEDTGDGAAAPTAPLCMKPAAMNLRSESYISAAGVSATDTGPPLPAPLMPPPRKSSSFGGELGRGAPLLLLEITCSRAQRHAEHLVNRRNTQTRKPTRNRTAGAPGLKMWIQEKQQERCERILTVVSEGEVEGQANAQILELKLLPQNITNRDEILAKDGWS